MQRFVSWTAMVLVMGLVTAACGSDSRETPAASTSSSAPTTTQAATTTVPPAETSTTTTPTTTATPATTAVQEPEFSLQLAADGWPELANGAHYEGWLIVDDVPVSTGRFNVAGGALVDLDGATIDSFELADDPSAASAVVITIEPSEDADPAPSESHFVAGDIVDGRAELTIDHPAALATDFSSASGAFVLATPTDGDRTNDEFSGVWFLVFPGPTAGLQLPELPEGWIYEGWTVIEGVPVTTGTFRSAEGQDDAAPYSGTVRTPNFPGEDFLVNAPEGLSFPTNLSGSTVVVSVEPLAEINPLPFAVTPLVGNVPVDAELEPVSYPITSDSFVAPTGLAIVG